MEDLDLPAHRIPPDLLDCLVTIVDLKVGQYFPLDTLAAKWPLRISPSSTFGLEKNRYAAFVLAQSWQAKE
jgi:hypothetical protein